MQTKSVSSGETKEIVKTYDLYRPSEREQEIVSDVFSKFTSYASNRNMNLAYFDGSNLTQYIEDSVRRYTTNLDIRPDIEDWQSILHDPVTRNKVNAVLSKVVAILPIAQIQARGDEDTRRASLLNEIYEYHEDIDDYEEFMVRYFLEAIVKGTAIGFEGQEYKKRKVRKITTGSGDDIKIQVDEITTNRLFADIVPLEDFYPANIGIPTLKNMGSCFVRKVLKHSEFLTQYSSMFEKCKFVQELNNTQRYEDSRPYYLDYVSEDVTDGSVEMLFWFDENSDEYIIIANGVWLNPIMTKTITGAEETGDYTEVDGEEISPLPWNHKELPFFDLRFELFGSAFFYGKSLPDKLKVLQDTLNIFENMLNDQSFLTIFAPILTNGFDSIDDDYLRPGRRTAIDTQGLPIQQSVMTLDMKTPGNWHQFILEYTRKVMEEASIDKVSQGVAGAGDRVTAHEISVAAEGVSSLLGLFGRWTNYAIRRNCRLKTKNICQFEFDGKSPVPFGVLNTDAKVLKDAFKTYTIHDTTLSNGDRGMKIIGLFSDKEKMPTGVDLGMHSLAYEAINDKKIEYVALDFDYIKNMDFDIKTTVIKKTELTRDMEKAIMMEKVRVYKSFFPNLVNEKELFAELLEKMGDDPTKMMNQDAVNTELGLDQNQNNPEAMSTSPEGDIMKNSMYGAMGKQVGVQNIKQLMG